MPQIQIHSKKKIGEDLFIVKNGLSRIKTNVKELDQDLLDKDYFSEKLIEFEDRWTSKNLRVSMV